jgi:type IV secretion system protein VirB11
MKRLDAKLKHELGPCIMSALENPGVLDICVNSDGGLWLDKAGEGLRDTGETIASGNILAALGTIAAVNGKELNESNSILEAVLPVDGSRVEGTLPPTTPEGPAMAIRKHASAIFPLTKYVEEKRISPEAAEYLKEAVKSAKNILIAGGTGSGKTTMVNSLILEIMASIPQDRLLLIEDNPELRCETRNKQRFVTSKDVSMQMLVKTALRFRPDRIIIGEVRDGAALDLLKAWNTGHPGGFATIHANDAHAALHRVEQLILEVAKNPLPSLIAEAVNVVVYMTEFGSIGKQVTEIIKVTGYQGGEYQYEPVYRIDGAHKSNIG